MVRVKDIESEGGNEESTRSKDKDKGKLHSKVTIENKITCQNSMKNI